MSYENQQSSDIKEQETMQADNSDYKVYGKYKVKSTYSGTDKQEIISVAENSLDLAMQNLMKRARHWKVRLKKKNMPSAGSMKIMSLEKLVQMSLQKYRTYPGKKLTK